MEPATYPMMEQSEPPMKDTAGPSSEGDKSKLRCISRLTMLVCALLFGYIGWVYNWVFLMRVLPAAGQEALVPVFAVLFNGLLGMAFWSYTMAHCSDPGRLARRFCMHQQWRQLGALQCFGRVPESWRDFVHNMGTALTVASARQEWQPGKATRCKKCGFARPERAHHCTICQMCVLRMDHHCPWIGNCVGFGNHKFFLQLAMYGCVGCCFGFMTVLPGLVEAMLVPLSQVSSHEDLVPLGNGLVAPNASAPGNPLPPVVVGTTQSIAPVRPLFAFTTSAAASLVTSIASATTTPISLWRTLASVDENASTTPGAFVPGVPVVATTTMPVSTTAEDSPGVDPSDISLTAVFAVLSFMVAVLLSTLLATHWPLACSNLTTIEENYDNMPNPFDHGTYMGNLAQIFGHFGPDWFLPVLPLKPLSDGVSYPRPGELALSPDLGLQPEDIWRLRYATSPPLRGDVDESTRSGILAPLSRWWRST